MGEFNTDHHYIYYYGQESLRRNGLAPIVNRVQNGVFGCNLKNDRMVFVHFHCKPFNITLIQVYSPTRNAKEAEVEWFYEDLLELITQKRCSFHQREMKSKSRQSRDTWSNRQIWPWSTEWSRERLKEFCQENSLVIANILFQQHKRRLYTWTSPDGQSKIRLIIFFAAEDGEALYSQQKQDQEMAITQMLTPYCDIQI